MTWMKGLIARARAVLAPNASERRMEEEFAFHVEMETRRLIREGVAEADARRRAVIAFGGMETHREAMRDGRGARWLEDLWADVRYAARAMRRSPGFAVAVAVTLGIGIGVNGIVFGFANSLLFRPVAARDAGELVSLFNRDVKSGQPRELGYQDYLDFRDRSGAFDGLAGFTGVPLNLVVPGAMSAGAADMVWAEMVTENYFTVLGQRPAAGRFFTPDDAPQGANPFAVISYASWKTRFGGDPAVIGRRLRINGTEFTITGVAAPGFKGLRTFGFWPEVWVPVGMHGIVMPGSSRLLDGRGGGWMMTIGRVRRGADASQTERAAIQFARQLQAQYPATNRGVSAQVIPAKAGFDNPSFVNSGVLLLASGLGVFASLVTLIIICANLANPQLARASHTTIGGRIGGVRIAWRAHRRGPRSRWAVAGAADDAAPAIPGGHECDARRPRGALHGGGLVCRHRALWRRACAASVAALAHVDQCDWCRAWRYPAIHATPRCARRHAAGAQRRVACGRDAVRAQLVRGARGGCRIRCP
jgi:hypothetical protein